MVGRHTLINSDPPEAEHRWPDRMPDPGTITLAAANARMKNAKNNRKNARTTEEKKKIDGEIDFLNRVLAGLKKL